MGRKRLGVTKTCETCHGVFTVLACHVEKRRFCSRKCAGVARSNGKKKSEVSEWFLSELRRLDESIARWKRVNEELKSQLATRCPSMQGAW